MSDLKNIRQATGLSVSQMATLIGLAGDNAGDKIREFERGKPLTGPMQAVLDYIAQGVETTADPVMTDLISRVLPEYLDCSDLADDESPVEIVMHTRYPRFFGIFVDDIADADAMIETGIGVVEMPSEAGLGWMLVIWIDRPVADKAVVAGYVRRAANLKIAQAVRDLGGM